jgi:hypothetical protein
MAQPTDNKIHFDKTINLGHLLTIISFLLITITQWNLMDKRIVVLEEFRTVQRERDTAQDAIARDKFQEVRDALVDLRRGIEKVADRVGVR